MSNKNKHQNEVASVTKTLVDIEPVATVYNIESDDVQTFLERYFENEGIKSVEAFRVIPVRTGSTRPEAKVYVFFDMNSNEVTNNKRSSNIPAALQNKIDQGGARLSNKLFEAVRPLIQGKPQVRTASSQGQRLVVVELDIFLVIGMMLSARRGQHDLVITEVKSLRRTTILTVVKSKSFRSNRGGSDSDRFTEIIEKQR